ncbi:flavin reductase family protein [Paraburkholderia strydomiana]|uniref:flavin reductase family protein n=1 Tax=Paraburkholderia strydomiana TaxID=1245417 RepID=UPI0038BBE1FC
MHADALRLDEPRAADADFDERGFRHALGRFATGVVVISTGSGERLHAMVSVGQSARMHERLMGCAVFGVSVLSDAQEAHSRHFAGEPQSRLAPCFAGVDGLADVVLLEHAAARFAARVVDRHPCGDHTLFVGEVLMFSLGENAPLVFFGGRYGSVAGSRLATPAPTHALPASAHCEHVEPGPPYAKSHD